VYRRGRPSARRSRYTSQLTPLTGHLSSSHMPLASIPLDEAKFEHRDLVNTH
jgi:hypothetical protein